MEKCAVLGVPFCVTNMKEALQEIEEHLEELRGEYVCFSNVHTTVLANDDSAYMKVQKEAAYIFPDGKPISKQQKKAGYPEAGRVAGPDFMGEMFAKCEMAQKEGRQLRHFFFGASEDTIKKLALQLADKYPHMQIAGMISPPFREVTPEEDKMYVDAINSARTDILWVGLGAPKQEKWMHAHRGRIHAVMMGVGAGFDFHAGTKKRAPKWMQKCSLEWFYRLLQDPRRLFKRYFVTNTKFMKMTMKEHKKND